MASVPVTDIEGRNSVLFGLLVKGVVQSDLYNALKISSRQASRLARTLEKRGLVIRKELVWKGRHSYWLKLSPKSSEQQLSAYLNTKKWGKPQPNLNFVAPDITPRTRQVVDLRLAGKTIKEIAEILGINAQTVEINLRYARDPRRYYLKAAQSRNKEDMGAQRAVPKLRQLVRERGYVISDDPSVNHHFIHAAELLERSDSLRLIRFPNKRYLLGSLANKSALYLDPSKLAEQIDDRIRREILSDFVGWRKEHFGKPPLVSHLRSGLTMILNEICRGDKILVWEVQVNLKPDMESLYRQGA